MAKAALSWEVVLGKLLQMAVFAKFLRASIDAFNMAANAGDLRVATDQRVEVMLRALAPRLEVDEMRKDGHRGLG
jgi:hypothetical protein